MAAQYDMSASKDKRSLDFKPEWEKARQEEEAKEEAK